AHTPAPRAWPVDSAPPPAIINRIQRGAHQLVGRILPICSGIERSRIASTISSGGKATPQSIRRQKSSRKEIQRRHPDLAQRILTRQPATVRPSPKRTSVEQKKVIGWA